MGLNKDIIQLVYDLLPGFVAAWVFFGLTAHPRRDVWERVLQALVFTAIIRVFTLWLRWWLLWIGEHVFTLGEWTDSVETVWSMLLAIVFGLVTAWIANNDVIHRWLREGKGVRELSITKKHSYASEWVSVFQREGRFVVLHLKDKRRLQGWPREWPDASGNGHFVLQCVHWLTRGESGTVSVPVPQVQAMVIPYEMVAWVEILTADEERHLTPEQISEAQLPIFAALTKKSEAAKENK
jgi:hypothetical protein